MANPIRDVYEFEAVVNVRLPDGGHFPADVSGTVRAMSWDDAEKQIREQTDIDGSYLKKTKMVRHCANGSTITRYDEWPDTRHCPEDAATPPGAEPEPKEDEFYWLGACAGVAHVLEDKTWNNPGDYPKEEI